MRSVFRMGFEEDPYGAEEYMGDIADELNPAMDPMAYEEFDIGDGMEFEDDMSEDPSDYLMGPLEEQYNDPETDFDAVRDMSAGLPLRDDTDVYEMDEEYNDDSAKEAIKAILTERANERRERSMAFQRKAAELARG